MDLDTKFERLQRKIRSLEKFLISSFNDAVAVQGSPVPASQASSSSDDSTNLLSPNGRSDTNQIAVGNGIGPISLPRGNNNQEDVMKECECLKSRYLALQEFDEILEGKNNGVANGCGACFQVFCCCLRRRCTNERKISSSSIQDKGAELYTSLCSVVAYFIMVILLVSLLQQESVEELSQIQNQPISIFMPLIRVVSLQFIKFTIEIILQCLFFEMTTDLQLTTLNFMDRHRLRTLVKRVQVENHSLLNHGQ